VDLDVPQERQIQFTGKRSVEGDLIHEAGFDRRLIGRDPDTGGDPGRLAQNVCLNPVPGQERDFAGQLRRVGWAGGNADGLTLNRQGG
jgi:hypothetical protein